MRGAEHRLTAQGGGSWVRLMPPSIAQPRAKITHGRFSLLCPPRPAACIYRSRSVYRYTPYCVYRYLETKVPCVASTQPCTAHLSRGWANDPSGPPLRRFYLYKKTKDPAACCAVLRRSWSTRTSPNYRRERTWCVICSSTQGFYYRNCLQNVNLEYPRAAKQQKTLPSGRIAF